MSESGFPGFDMIAWFGLLAPAGSPAAEFRKKRGEAEDLLIEYLTYRSSGDRQEKQLARKKENKLQTELLAPMLETQYVA